MSAKLGKTLGALAMLGLGLWGCAPGPMEFASRATHFVPPEGCTMRKGAQPNTLVCGVPVSATVDRHFTFWTDFAPATEAQRTGHAQSGARYWTAAFERHRRAQVRKVGTVLRESYEVEDPGPHNATACLRTSATTSRPSLSGDVRLLDCVFYEESTGEAVFAMLEYTEARTSGGAATPGFVRDAEAALSSFRFTPPLEAF